MRRKRLNDQSYSQRMQQTSTKREDTTGWERWSNGNHAKD